MTYPYPTPNELKITGFKLIDKREAEFMKKLLSRDDSMGIYIQSSTLLSLSWRIENADGSEGYAIATFDINRKIPQIEYSCRDEIRGTLKSSDGYTFADVESFVLFLEVNYQIDQHISVAASKNPNDFGYDPSCKVEGSHLVPLTLQNIERVPLRDRIPQLERIFGTVEVFKDEYSSLGVRKVNAIWGIEA